MSGILGLITNIAAGTFKDWLTSKAEADRIRAQTRAKAVSEGIPGWSDELFAVVWALPMIAAFIPGLREEAQAGFALLESFPEWYVGGFLTVTGAIFGIDKWIKFKGRANG